MAKGTSIGSVFMDAFIDSKRFKKDIGGMERTATKAFSKIGAMVAAAFSVRAVWNFGKDSIEAANKSASAWLGLKSVVEGMGGSFKQSQGYLNKFVADGLVPATNAAAAYKNLVSAGYDASQIEGIMEAFKNSAVYSRQSGLTIGEAVQTAAEGLKNLNSINVDNAGVTKNLSVMQKEYAASIGKTVGNLTDAEIRTAHYLGIMEATKVQMKDAASYSETYAGRVSRLSASFTKLKEVVGSIVQYFVSNLLPVMQRAIDVTTTFANTIRKLLGIKEITASGGIADGVTGIASGASDAADGLNDTAKAAKKVKNALAGIDEINTLQMPEADAAVMPVTADITPSLQGDYGSIELPVEVDDSILGKVTGLIDNIKKALKPTLDEFAKLKDVLKGIGSVALEGLIDFHKTFLKPVGAWAFGENSGIAKFISVLREMIEAIDWGKIKESLHSLWESLSKFTINIGDGLLWLWENVLAPFGTWVISDVVPAFLDVLANAIEVINEVVEALKPLASWLWENFLEPLAKWTGGIVVDALNLVADALGKISDWIKENQSFIQTATLTVGAFFLAWKTTELFAFIQMSGGVIAVLKNVVTAIKTATIAKIIDKAETIYLTALYAKDFVVSIAKSTAALVKQCAQWVITTGLKVADTAAQIAMTAATVAWNVAATVGAAVTTAFGAAVAFLTSPITLVVLAIVALIAIVVLLVKNWDTVKEVAANVWEGIKNTWNAVATWFDDSVVKPIGRFFSTMWDSLKSGALGAWEGIKNAFSKVTEWFKNVFANAWQAVKDVFSAGGQVFSGIKEGIESTFKTVVNGLITGINAIISIPFKTINGMLNKIRGISVLGVAPFKGMWGENPLPVPQIPKLAKGGIIDAPTLAMVGEAGKEAVVPLENNSEWMDTLASIVNNAVISAVSAMTANNQSSDRPLVMELDGATLARVIMPYIADNIRRTGVRLA